MEPKSIPQGRLYKDLAFLFALVTPREDYAEEAAQWLAILREKLGPGKHKILELGVGAGHNLSYMSGEFEAMAVDSSPEMLKLCEKINPSVVVHQGDMRDIRLGRKIEHDRHTTGLFPRASWIKLMEKAGFAVEPKIITSEGVPHELLVGTLWETKR